MDDVAAGEAGEYSGDDVVRHFYYLADLAARSLHAVHQQFDYRLLVVNAVASLVRSALRLPACLLPASLAAMLLVSHLLIEVFAAGFALHVRLQVLAPGRFQRLSASCLRYA